MPVRGIDVPEFPHSEPEYRALLAEYMERTRSDLRDVARHGVRPGVVAGDALALQVLACHELLRSVEPGMVLDAGCFLARAYGGNGSWSEFHQTIRALDEAERDELSRTRPVCLSLDDPLFAAGLVLFEHGRVDEALEVLEGLNALSFGGLRSRLLAAIASCHHRKRDWETAVAWYGEAAIHCEADILDSPEESRYREVADWQVLNAAMRDAQNRLEHVYRLTWFGGGQLAVRDLCLSLPLKPETGWSLAWEKEAARDSGALDGNWVLRRLAGDGPPREERLGTFRLPVFWHWGTSERLLCLYVAETAAGGTLDACADRIEWSRGDPCAESLPAWLERIRGSSPVHQAVLSAQA